eukprot:3689692-Pyramimonas_sp.AAC.1
MAFHLESYGLPRRPSAIPVARLRPHTLTQEDFLILWIRERRQECQYASTIQPSSFTFTL